MEQERMIQLQEQKPNPKDTPTPPQRDHREGISTPCHK